MKKIIMALAIAGVFSINLSKAADKCRDCSQGRKVTHNKVVRDSGKGLARGYYYTTHNKFTKVIKLNDGNTKHSNKDRAERKSYS